ncbi:MAG: hypothetical protein IPH95_18465 [Candidatus Promineofilum sp.]|nr:hypothetical protein [Promineifilum sp.]
MKRRVWWLLAIGVVLALALAACGGGGGTAEPTADAGAAETTEDDAGETTEDDAADDAADGEKITIKLAENPWSASMINANVAKILL